MAEANISVDQEEFTCSICLKILKDPVTINCGHSFCMECINTYWNASDHRGIYSCPQCRETYSPRPILRKNNIIAEVVEKLKRTASSVPQYAGPGDVACDYCTGRKQKAIKSCLMCMVSLCKTHLKPHHEVPALINHKLVKACTDLQERLCSRHDKLLDIYCQTDQTCICYLCMVDEHRGHDTASVSAKRTEKQSQVEDMLKECQQRIYKKQRKVQKLLQTVDMLKSAAQGAVEDSEKIFSELISSLKKKCSEVTERIRAQEKAELSRATQILGKLEQEIDNLKRKDAELLELSHTEDHVHFLQNFKSLCISSETEDSSSIALNQSFVFHGVKKSLSELKRQVGDFVKEPVQDQAIYEKTTPKQATVRPTALDSSLEVDPLTRQIFRHLKGSTE
ncbi:E3 ubiquitin/ISG15 ligase TRIM25-like [Neoarius graeffei]|uniref:E3 ubiquitin/ISG15 ligase TRIM25-like n=1 Tax=Neoarius graeffei TaxID=443677 RepID=UPI00298D25A7|nr:E3 ubiquitin/ISG15 ligase TRIM25-like [Neoarius graeffei]